MKRQYNIHVTDHPGVRLREEMKKRGITVTELAKELGVGRCTISDIANHHIGVSNRMAEKLATKFCTTTWDWITLDEEHKATRNRLKRMRQLRMERGE